MQAWKHRYYLAHSRHSAISVEKILFSKVQWGSSPSGYTGAKHGADKVLWTPEYTQSFKDKCVLFILIGTHLILRITRIFQLSPQIPSLFPGIPQ